MQQAVDFCVCVFKSWLISIQLSQIQAKNKASSHNFATISNSIKLLDKKKTIYEIVLD